MELEHTKRFFGIMIDNEGSELTQQHIFSENHEKKGARTYSQSLEEPFILSTCITILKQLFDRLLRIFPL